MPLTPIQLEVLWNRLLSVANEQQTTLIRTAFSTIVRESLDLACGIFDTRGQMIAQSDTGTPGHINPMATGAIHLLNVYPPETLEPGDVLVTNDPWLTAGQVNDFTVLTPVFRSGATGSARAEHSTFQTAESTGKASGTPNAQPLTENRIVAYISNCCHSPDIGGRILSAEAHEVFEEGLQVPITKLFRAGEPNEELFKIIRANVRTPDETVGDLYAQASSNAVGARSLLAMMDEFSLDTIDPLADEIIARSEQAMRDGIRALPNGRYEHETFSDGFEEPLRIKVAVTVEDEDIHIDFDGSSPQSQRGINVVLNYTQGYASFAMKAAISPEVPHNEGAFRPVTITAPEGCILNCKRPAAVASRHLVGHFLPSAIFGALAQVIPERVMAGSADPIWMSIWRAKWPNRLSPEKGTGSRPNVTNSNALPPPRSGAPTLPQAGEYSPSVTMERGNAGKTSNFTSFMLGGTGARPTKDGLNTTGFPSGVGGVPTEIAETQAPLIQHHRKLRTNSGGAGEFRGGLGQDIAIGYLGEEPWSVSGMVDRTKYPADGLKDGQPGGIGEFKLDDEDAPTKTIMWMEPESIVQMNPPGGGGFGHPFERDPEAVLNDVVNGYITMDAAREHYGVVVTFVGSSDALVRLPSDYKVDEAATTLARSQS